MQIRTYALIMKLWRCAWEPVSRGNGSRVSLGPHHSPYLRPPDFPFAVTRRPWAGEAAPLTPSSHSTNSPARALFARQLPAYFPCLLRNSHHGGAA